MKIDNIKGKLYRPLSKPFTSLFLKIGINPNPITILSIILLLIGAFFFLTKSYLLGFFSLFFSNILDHSDGDVARAKNMTSKEGKYLDTMAHTVVEPLIFMAFFYSLGLEIYALFIPFCYIATISMRLHKLKLEGT